MKPSSVCFSLALLLAVALALSQSLAAPAPPERPKTDAQLAVAGLRPYTPETGNLSLADFRRLLHPLKADLVITKVTVDPPQPKVGELVGTTLHYKNIGGKPARGFYLRQEPGTLGEGGWGLGGDYALLAPGQEKVYLGSAIRPRKAGVHTLTFCIDPEGSVEESNRRNNRHSVRVRVVAP